MMKYLLAGGGTAGHVNPLLALAETITNAEPNRAEVLVLGTEEGLESRFVPQRGYELVTIERLPFPRRLNQHALVFAARYLRAVNQVRALIRAREIEIVVGFGGYVAAPAYRAARLERIPYVIHEANAKPGLANRQAARHTRYVGVAFAGTPLRGARVTGMPLRSEIATLNRSAQRASAREYFGLDRDRVTLLVTGGSQGAQSINQAIVGSALDIVAAGVQVLHVWGGLTELRDPGVAGYRVLPYCERMELAFAASDLVISRAGSSTVSELTALGLPSVLVPYASGNGEQRVNADSVVRAGGALLAEDRDLGTAWVRGTLMPLLSDESRLARMSVAAASVGSIDGAVRLYGLVREAYEARDV